MEKKLEQMLPVSVENDVILSDSGDISAVFRASYPEILTRSAAEYEAMHAGRIRALRTLPPRTIFAQQDLYRKKVVRPSEDISGSFLARAGDRFFAGRPYFDHASYVTVTQMPPTRKAATSLVSSLLTGRLVPAQTLRAAPLQLFEAALSQFCRLMGEAGIGLRRVRDGELLSTPQRAGWLERYLLQLPAPEALLIKDLDLSRGRGVMAGRDACLFFTLAEADSLPASCSPWTTLSGYSTDKTRFPVGFGAQAGPLLSVDHLYNQFIVLEETQETRVRLEKKNKRLTSLARYSRENALSQVAVNDYLNEMLSESRRPCRVHFNVMTIASGEAEARRQTDLVSAAFGRLDAVAKLETLSAPQLYWAGIPGNVAELPRDHTVETFTEQAACFLNSDGGSQSDPTGIRFADRLSGRPVLVDLFDQPLKTGIITNRNLFVCGGSGGGKSMTMNHMLRTLYDQGAHSVTVDIGGSYRGLCELCGGYYFTYTEENPIRFNPFNLAGAGKPDTEKKESLKALLVALWKQEQQSFNRSEYVALSNALQGYYQMCAGRPELFPCFDTFYEYLQTDYAALLTREEVLPADFDLHNFLYVLRPYYRGGEFDYLLNARENLDLVDERFIVFELDNIKDHPILFPVVTLIIMELFVSKMRKLPGTRKILVIEEAWKSIAKAGMAEFIKYVFKTVRKFNGIAAVVTQEIDDLITSPIIKEAIINNADIKILMDMRKFMNKFDALQATLGLSDKAKTILLSVNRDLAPGRSYREVFIDLGGQVMKVYRNELSPEEYYAYTTEASEKLKVLRYAERCGSLEQGIRTLVGEETAGGSG